MGPSLPLLGKKRREGGATNTSSRPQVLQDGGRACVNKTGASESLRNVKKKLRFNLQPFPMPYLFCQIQFCH